MKGKKRKSNKELLLIIAIVMVGIVIGITPYVIFGVNLFTRYYYNSAVRFNEEDFVGKTEEQIQDKYGKFEIRRDIDNDGIVDEVAYYIETIQGKWDGKDYCYYIFFDNSGKAIGGDVKVAGYHAG